MSTQVKISPTAAPHVCGLCRTEITYVLVVRDGEAMELSVCFGCQESTVIQIGKSKVFAV